MFVLYFVIGMIEAFAQQRAAELDHNVDAQRESQLRHLPFLVVCHLFFQIWVELEMRFADGPNTEKRSAEKRSSSLSSSEVALFSSRASFAPLRLRITVVRCWGISALRVWALNWRR